MAANNYVIYRPSQDNLTPDVGPVGSVISLDNTAGPSFTDPTVKITYEKINSYSSPYVSDVVDTTQQPAPTNTIDVTTLFLIDSKNRDKSVFPQPTNFTLKPPRVYKNIKSVQVTQIKLLSSFFYFRTDKGNTFLPLIENGRANINNYLSYPLTAVITIPQGSYTIDDLLSRLQILANRTPIFYDFPNGYTDFANNFKSIGDYSVNFNQPGDTYYDRLNSTYKANPTLATITAQYWGSRYAGLINYSTDQIKVAYYYPVLYEAILDTEETRIYPLLDLTIPPLIYSGSETVYSHILYNFSGLNDPIILYLINQNLSLLDQYRLYNTFRYSPVNRYTFSYDPNTLRVSIESVSLNLSLVNLFNQVNSTNLASVLNLLNISATDYSSLVTIVNTAKVIYNDMYNYIQSQLTSYFAIPYATYSAEYFNTITNTMYIQNGVDALGIRSGYTLEYLKSGQNPISSMVNTYSNSPGYWPNFNSINTDGGARGGGFKYSEINPAISMIPYNQYSKNFQFDKTSIDPDTYYLNTNKVSNSLDVVVNIKPARYTVIKFRSSARQTLQVETLPLPYYYRFSEYNKQGLYKGILDPLKNNVPQEYFDLSHSYVYDVSNNFMDNNNAATAMMSNTFGQPYYQTFTQTPLVDIDSQNNYKQYEFTAPYPPGITDGLVVYPLNISFVSMLTNSISTMFSGTFNAFLYHDRAAFMADVLKSRKENPAHYIASKTVGTDQSDITFNVSTFARHKYYAIFRSDTLACSNIQIKPFVYYSDSNYTPIQTDYVNFSPTGNPTDASNVGNYPFVVNYNTDYIRFPFTSTLQGTDPSNPSFNLAVPIGGNPIGYDSSGVSDDLTDYQGFTRDTGGFTPGTQYRIDPLSYYTFQNITPFDPINKTYLGSNSQNQLLTPVRKNPYRFNGTSNVQLKIVHWYDGYSIPQQEDDININTLNNVNIALRSSIKDYLPGFPRNSNGDVKFGRGINAIGFTPVDGVYDVTSFSFKSAIYPTSVSNFSSDDPNSRIQYIGVFLGLYLSGNIIEMSSALAVLQFSSAVVYGPSTLSNTPGFGSEQGTWYNYAKTSLFSSVSLQGYTPNSNDLLGYNSMYYMVPFDGNGNSLTFSHLVGSSLPYPLSQVVSTGKTFYGKTIKPIVGAQEQPVYVIPSTIGDANPVYGPGAGYSDTQSQYELSMPITTPSIGYREYQYLVTEKDSLYPFTSHFYTSGGIVAPFTMGLTTYVSEYSDTLYLVNSLSNNLAVSNVGRSFSGASYASSISTFISNNHIGSLSSISYLLSTPSTLQNYTFSGNINNFSTFLFQAMPGNDSNVTMQSFEVSPSMNNLTFWLWGGGGATASNQSNVSGGAGGYIKATINATTLLNTPTADCPGGISTLYFVVGKGGNRDNTSFITTTGIYHGYEQPRYGGGGTSVLINPLSNDESITDEISLQGGGFSGIFTGSNLITATPLLIVGGGGAAGASDFGGPGGIGVSPDPLPIVQRGFASVNSSAIYYGAAQVTSIVDLDSNSVINGSNISNTVDGSIVTFWDPTPRPYMNSNNYSPTPNIYRVQVNYADTRSPVKLRYYGSKLIDTQHLPTGFVVYTSENKAEMLYSNTTIEPSQYQGLENGVFNQAVYEIFPTGQASTVPFTRNGWIVGGLNTSGQNSLQYSVDGLTWVPVTANSLLTTRCVLYVSAYGLWYSCGSGGILKSADGLNWTSLYSTTNIVLSLVSGTVGTSTSIVAALTDGSFLVSIDGYNWSQITNNKFSSQANRVRYLNGSFWATGSSDTILKKSIDGLTWSSVIGIGIMGAYDIAYGLGRYILAQSNNTPPFNSSLLFSSDGITWSATSQLNTSGFNARSVVFGNGIFVACGSTTDGTSFIKYSTDGINWYDSSFPLSGDGGRNEVQFINGSFVCLGAGIPSSNRAGNQASIVMSSDGIDWVYSQIGGFNPDVINTAQAISVAYGPITIQPSLSSVYIEIQNSQTRGYEPHVYEMRAYTTSNVLTTPTSTLFDGNFNTIFSPTDSEARDIFQYPFTLSFSNSPVPLINTLRIYTPTGVTGLFTGLTVSLNSTPQGLVYSSQAITANQFSLTTTSNGIKNLFTVVLNPPITAMSTLLLNFTKVTSGTIQINEIQAYNDENLRMVQYTPNAVTDLDSRISTQPLANLFNGSLISYWSPTSFQLGTNIRLNFTFSTLVNQINTLHIYNDIYGTSATQITRIRVYSDSTMSQILYSNDSINPINSMGYSLFSVPLYSYGPMNNIYVELSKVTPGTPLINEIRFFNTGSSSAGTTVTGYSGGLANLIQKTTMSPTPYDGGGGGSLGPGSAGTNSYMGGYLVGGSPAQAGIVTYSTNVISTTMNLAGGGGGGYYGGGGGGSQSNLGGAGGGGAGYIYKPIGTSLITVLDYGTATPLLNYGIPRSNEYNLLVNSNIVPGLKGTLYGQGGKGLVDFGQGSHGLVSLSYESNVTVVPPASGSAIPCFIDGSKLTVFETPINYNTDDRTLSFRTFTDSIEMTSYSGFNWVWYSSYLSMTGATLLSTMTASSLVSQVPSISFPSLPSNVYTILANQFSNVSTFYGSGKSFITFSNASNITTSINTAFGQFQSTFVTVPYTAPNYIEMTETYCLLDYLRNSSNLLNPHVNPINSRMDRIFGGVPRFGYWANPFLTNVSYIGFDVGPSLFAPSSLSTISGSSNQVRALYDLVLEQCLSTGVYQMKDIMAYKPTLADATLNGLSWLTVTQFNESYHIRNLTDTVELLRNIPAQPYTIRNGMNARLPLFSYKVYTTPLLVETTTIQSPIHMIKDFEGNQTFLYSFQNTIVENTSSINLTSVSSFTSTMLNINQSLMTTQSNLPGKSIGTIVSEKNGYTIVETVNQFGYNSTDTVNFTPIFSYSTNPYYNTYTSDSELGSSNVGKAILDSLGNFYASDNQGSANFYENICTTKIYQKSFANSNISYASPGFLLGKYNSGMNNPVYDFLVSKTTNIWHIQGSSNLSTIYGARLTSPYDFNVTTNFANQVFYPTHKIVLVKKSSSTNPITDTTDLTTYPSYTHSQLFFYNNFSTMTNDIQGKFASENTNNFINKDDTSGYFMNSYINNISLAKSGPIVNDDSFNYLAVRAYSPSESFQTLLRFYLAERYDFGYISLQDLSGEISTIQTAANVNPDYKRILTSFHSSFNMTKIYGAGVLPNFSGSNITSSNFGDFLNQYNKFNSTIIAGTYITNQVNTFIANGQSNLILGDLKNILPSYLASRGRVTDPLEFKVPFSTVVSFSNRGIDEYGLGYNLGFSPVDTGFNTIQRGGSFFKILDDYIYMKMNPEFNMNRLDISQPENFAETHDATAQTQLYNCKLLLNNFGSYSTTFVQNTVNFNPPIGKLDKLSFSWYDITGNLINNDECEWSGAIQIVETVDVV